MKIQMTRGCIANSLTVDGKEEINLSDDEPCETCGDYVETYTWEI